MENQDMLNVRETIVIDRPPEDIFRFWRRFENLPVFMDHLKEVKLNHSIYHWKAKAPLGTSVEWDAIVTNEIENKMIQWKSTENSEVRNSGAVWFTHCMETNHPSASTLVEVELKYKPPFGKFGAAIASLFGENPAQQIKDDLHKLKVVMEKY
jgi:uncharacterized membrane protein